MAKMDISLKKVITPEFRASFPQLFEAKSFQNQDAKFSVVMLFDKKTTDLKAMKKAAANAAIEKWGADKAKWPKNLRDPFRDGEEKADMEGYKGCTFVSASSKAENRPGLVDENVERIMDKSKFYAGCYARAELIAFAYDVSGNRGISFSLQNVQKLRDGKPFSGRKNAEDVFDKVEKAEDSEESYGGDSENEDEAIDSMFA